MARADQRGQEQYLMDWQWSTAEATDCLNQEITCSSVYIKLYFSAPQLDLYSAGLVRRAGCALPVLSPGGPGAVCFFSGRYPLSAALSGRDRDFSPAFAPAVAAGKQPDHPAQGALLKRFVQEPAGSCPGGRGIQ